MRNPAPHHHPRQIERPDDDLPNVPYPWQPEPSGQARRSECQKLAHLEPSNAQP
jgi:hypothetical protein